MEAIQLGIITAAQSRPFFARFCIYEDVQARSRFFFIDRNRRAICAEGATCGIRHNQRHVKVVGVGIRTEIRPLPICVEFAIASDQCFLCKIQESLHVFYVEARASNVIRSVAVLAKPTTITVADITGAHAVHARVAESFRAQSWIASVTIDSRPANITGITFPINDRPGVGAAFTVHVCPLVLANALAARADSMIAGILIALVTILAFPAPYATGARGV
jgi:hypothetical protein